MLISTEVNMLVSKRFNLVYKKLGYIYNKVGDTIKLKIEHLSKNSHLFVDVSCDYCDKLLHITYRDFNNYTKDVNKISCSDVVCVNKKIKDVFNVKYGVDNSFQLESVKTKSKETFIEKYGVEHPMYLQSVKDKINNTCMERYGETSYMKTDEFLAKTIITNIRKYGVEHNSQSEEMQEKRKNTRINKKTQLPDDKIPEYTKYRRIVDNLTERIKKDLFNNWDGYDYYDNQYIKDNIIFNSNSNLYPSIDHKTSVYNGFINNVPAHVIADMSNLCITKRFHNSSKSFKMNSDDYKIKISLIVN